jgi:hypothetical protein
MSLAENLIFSKNRKFASQKRCFLCDASGNFSKMFEIDYEILIGIWYKNACRSFIKPCISIFSQKFPKT